MVAKLNAAANKALKEDEVASKLRASGFEPLGGPSDEFARFIGRESVKWSAAAEAAGLKK